MALIDPAPIDTRIKELHDKKILITICIFWLEARFAFCDYLFTKGLLRETGMLADSYLSDLNIISVCVKFQFPIFGEPKIYQTEQLLGFKASKVCPSAKINKSVFFAKQ